jgi:homoaconitate hydratase
MSQTVVEKIAQLHMTAGPDRPLRTGDVISLAPRHVMTHDNTAPVMEKFVSIGASKIHDPKQPVFTLDHDIQNTSDVNLAKYSDIEAFAKEHGVDFYPAGAGIGHQMMVSMGYVVPGSLVVASDSHSNMYGALGALGTPVVRTDAAAIWATGEFWWQIPRTVQVVLDGRLREGVTGKDVIITLCGLYDQDEVLNAAVEFVGSGVPSLSMDGRMSISNMTTEWGALVGLFPADAVTIRYLERRKAILDALGVIRFTDEDLERWEAEPLASDTDASFAATIELELGDVSPHVSGPDSVKVMRPVSEMEKDRIAIQKAYLVSCVNSRLEDLEAAARVTRGKKVAAGVEFYVSAASKEVQQDAEASEAWGALLAAGAKPLPPGCGPCIGLGAGLLEPGEVGISATNRNFKGRMGSREAQCYLASPEVVAASALAGHVAGPTRVDDRLLERRFTERAAAPEPEETVAIQDGFPEKVVGRLVFVPQDNLNTDGIYGKDYTYREGMTPDEMARVVMENYDPEFAARTKERDVLVGGSNFGTGSSREQAATSLQAKGIPMIIAASFSQTYLRNAYNNGYPCIACPALVKRLKEYLEDEVAQGQLTIMSFGFAALGAVPQSLVVAGGVENQVRERLGR